MGNKRRVPFIILTVFLLLVAAFCIFFSVNQFSLSVQLLGEEKITLEYGAFYQEQGAEAVLSGKFFLKDGSVPRGGKLTISGQVDPMHLGRYTITYTAKYFFWKAEAHRTVCVGDTQAPEIILQPDSEASLRPGTIYQEAGYAEPGCETLSDPADRAGLCPVPAVQRRLRRYRDHDLQLYR